jgi:hypothetical protein
MRGGGPAWGHHLFAAAWGHTLLSGNNYRAIKNICVLLAATANPDELFCSFDLSHFGSPFFISKGTFPLGDHNGGKAITDDVDRCPSHVH